MYTSSRCEAICVSFKSFKLLVKSRGAAGIHAHEQPDNGEYVDFNMKWDQNND